MDRDNKLESNASDGYLFFVGVKVDPEILSDLNRYRLSDETERNSFLETFNKELYEVLPNFNRGVVDKMGEAMKCNGLVTQKSGRANNSQLTITYDDGEIFTMNRNTIMKDFIVSMLDHLKKSDEGGEPAPAEPASLAEPAPAEPAPAEPSSLAEPAPEEPAPAEPAPAEPAPTDPEDDDWEQISSEDITGENNPPQTSVLDSIWDGLTRLVGSGRRKKSKSCRLKSKKFRSNNRKFHRGEIHRRKFHRQKTMKRKKYSNRKKINKSKRRKNTKRR
jgi:hypothetical protein